MRVSLPLPLGVVATGISLGGNRGGGWGIRNVGDRK